MDIVDSKYGVKSTKSEPIGFGFVRFGGDEGSRTPVRKTDTPGIYERSLCFFLVSCTPTNRITTDQSGKFPVSLPDTDETVVC